MNFNCPVLETSESIEPKDYDDLELNAIACTFSKIFQSELKELLRQYRELLPSEVNKETEKNFLCSGRFPSVVEGFRNTKARREGKTKWTKSAMKQVFSLAGIVKTKHQRLTSLASM